MNLSKNELEKRHRVRAILYRVALELQIGAEKYLDTGETVISDNPFSYTHEIMSYAFRRDWLDTAFKNYIKKQ